MKATVSVTHRGTAAACCFVNNSIQKHRKRERNKFHMLQMNKKSAPRERERKNRLLKEHSSKRNQGRETLLTLVWFLIISYVNNQTKISRDETFRHLLQDHPPNGLSLRQINICLAPHLDGSPHLQPQVL